MTDDALKAMADWLDRLRLPAEWPEHNMTRARELAEHMEREGFEVRRIAE